METPTPKLARRAAVLLRAFASNFDGKAAPASLATIREQKKSSDTGQWWNLPANISDGELKRFEKAKARTKK